MKFLPGLPGCVPASGFVVPAVPMPSARVVGTGATAAQPRSATTAMSLLMTAAGDGGKRGPWVSFATDLAKKAAVAATVAAVAFSATGDALANSGGRISGGSFSGSSGSHSSSGGSSSDFSYYGKGRGYITDRTDAVLFFGAVGAAYGLDRGVEELAKRVRTRFGFGNLDDYPPSSLGEGVDVIKLQFAINCCDRGSNSILGVLEDVAARGDTESCWGLAEVVSEISLALERRSPDWLATASELEHFDSPNTERAEATFSQYTVQFRAKIERETNAVEGGKDVSLPRSEEGNSAAPSTPTVAVVCLVTALRGDALKRLGLDKSVSVSGLKSALQALSSGSLSDDGHNVLAAEVLWTPEEPWEVLRKEDAMTDFPDLLDSALTC